MTSPERYGGQPSKTATEFILTAYLLDNRNAWLDGAAADRMLEAIRRHGLPSAVIGLGEQSEAYLAIAVQQPDSTAAVDTTVFVVQDALEAAGTDPHTAVQVRTLSATADQLRGVYVEDVWPIMQDRTQQLDDIHELQGVLGDSVVIADFL